MAKRSLTPLVAFDNASQAEDNGNPRRWAILVVLSAVAFMAQLDFFIVNVALAGIGKDFSNSGLTGVSWVLNAYAIVFAAVLVFAGRIADLRGRKKVLLFDVALFTAASVACAVAQNLSVLIGGRVVQAERCWNNHRSPCYIQLFRADSIPWSWVSGLVSLLSRLQSDRLSAVYSSAFPGDGSF